MRVVSINLDMNRVLPGDTLSGQVTIRTSKSFECNRVVLKIIGKERTERPAGDTTLVEEKHHINAEFRISEGGIIAEGISRFPFSFSLPSNLPPSYQGINGFIEYSVRSVVEINWVRDPASEEIFRVLQATPLSPPELFDIRLLNQTSGHLHVKLDSNKVRLNKGISVEFMVDKRSRVREVRFEILKREETICQGFTEDSSQGVISEFYPVAPDDFGKWRKIQVGEELDCHLPFRGELISVSYFLKVSLGIAFALDPDVVIPLQFSEDVKIGDVLDEIERGLWRV